MFLQFENDNETYLLVMCNYPKTTNIMEIRPAILTDSNSITLLNNRYYKAYLEGDKEKGFLKNSSSILEIEELINVNEIIVAEIDNQIIGYYLVNSIHETLTIINRKKIIKELILQNKIPNGRYVYLTQAVVDKPFMQKGIAKELLINLKILVKEKFDYLIGFIDNENINAKEAHLKSGWEIITSFENGHLALTKV